jgi:hypothetical protein
VIIPIPGDSACGCPYPPPPALLKSPADLPELMRHAAGTPERGGRLD